MSLWDYGRQFIARSRLIASININSFDQSDFDRVISPELGFLLNSTHSLSNLLDELTHIELEMALETQKKYHVFLVSFISIYTLHKVLIEILTCLLYDIELRFQHLLRMCFYH